MKHIALKITAFIFGIALWLYVVSLNTFKVELDIPVRSMVTFDAATGYLDRPRVVQGKSVRPRVDLGGRRIIKHNS